MFDAAAAALAGRVDDELIEAGRLYPPLKDLRVITRDVAAAVARAAVADGVGVPLGEVEIDEALDREIWNLDYPTLLAI